MNFGYFDYIRQEANFPPVDPQWLEWFVGFCEAQGSFSLSEYSPGFVLTCEDESVLKMIQNTLGIGKVSHDDTYRWKVQEMMELRQLIGLLSDNMVLSYRVEGLNSLIDLWNNFYINRYGELVDSILIEKVSTVLLPSLASAWLSGFTDGCGSFSLTSQNRNGSLLWKWRARLQKTQAQEVFVHLATLFGFPSSSVSSRKGRQGPIPQLTFPTSKLDSVAHYYQEHPLKVKGASLNRYLQSRAVYLDCKANKVSPDNKLLVLAKQINSK